MTVIYAMEISRMSREVGCYPDISIAYHIFIYYTCDYRIGQKKLFEVEIIEELSEVNNDPREVIWFGNIMESRRKYWMILATTPS